MPKRRREEKLESYRKKIRKMERRMKQLRERYQDEHSSEEEGDTTFHVPEYDNDTSSEVEMLCSPQRDQSPDEPLIQAPAIDKNLSDENNKPMSECEKTNDAPTEAIPPEVLLALGDLMPEKRKYGPPINNEVARIWSNILQKGLPKENKQNIMQSCDVPENCCLLKAPKLNTELTTSVYDNVVKRDKKFEIEQNQLGIGLSLISSALSTLINNGDRLKIISLLSDAGRILTDLHFIQTKNRKNLICQLLDKKFTEAIKDVDRDEFLYGSNFMEKIKALKSSQRIGQSIKRPTTNNNQNRQGNVNGPPRSNQQRTAQRYGQKKMQSSTSTQARKYPNPQYQATNPKKLKTTREKPPART